MEEPPAWARLASGSLVTLGEITRPMEAAGRVRQRQVVLPDVDFTLRDEANALTAYAFRNGYLETLHAGASGFSDEEMRKLMIESSARLAFALGARDADPERYMRFLIEYGSLYSYGWDRERERVELEREHLGACPSCGKSARVEWSFCASCGLELGARSPGDLAQPAA
jgi:hypothetical protein